MVTRILFTILVSFFLFQSIQAQDTAKSINNNKHRNRNHINDSLKAARLMKRPKENDTAKLHKTYSAKIPKYKRNGYIAILGGLGIPNNSFSSGGNAANGKIYSLSAAFPGVISNGGIAFKFDHGINGINETQLVESLNSQTASYNVNSSLTGTIGQYYYSTLLCGLYLTFPGKHITIDARILAGVMLAELPPITVNYNNQYSGNSGTYYQAITSGKAFAFDMGIEARYRVYERFCIILSADYLTAAPSFNNITTGAGLSSSGNIIQETGRETIINQSFDLSNFSLGVGYIISAQKKSAPIDK
jgi:hypothetical protein